MSSERLTLATAAPAPTAAPPAATPTGFPLTTGDLNVGGRTTAASGAPTGTASRNVTSTRTQFDARNPAGQVVMLTPAPSLGLQLFKIGEYMTMGWNYTNVLAHPTAINVLATNTINSQTYTLTTNMTYTASGGSFTWDTQAYVTGEAARETPLLTAEYTLIIHDADGPAVGGIPEAGYLQPFSGLVFGLYEPRPYVPLAGGQWICATCSSPALGRSDLVSRGAAVVVAAAAAAIVAFVW